jgi:branched-chain amino acid transport system permease protein
MLGQTIFNALLLGMTYVVVASGLTLVFGVMHIFNFAHGELYMLGGFIGYFLLEFLGFNFFLAMVLTMAVMFFIGVLIERYAFRPVREKLIPSMILSLGLSLVLSGFALLAFTENDLSVDSPFPGTLQLLGIFIPLERLMVIIICFLIMGSMFFFLHRFKWGRALRAVAIDPEAALLQGINIDLVYSLSFGISSALAAAAGVMILPLFKVNAHMGTAAVTNSLAVIVLGGMGSIPGSVAGGLLLGIVNAFATTYIGGTIGGIFAFIMIIVMIMVRPKGLLGHE